MYTKEGTILDRREMLRVKIKSLAEEARIIRREERRSNGPLRDELHIHRVIAVRSEARVAQLAYGFIRGRAYERLEPKANTPPDWKRVRALCKKYGPSLFEEPAVMREPIAAPVVIAPPSQLKGVLQKLVGVRSS